MTVVKSVSDGLRDSETQLNLNRPLRISPGPWPPEPSLITCLGALNAQKSGKIFQKKKSTNLFLEKTAQTHFRKRQQAPGILRDPKNTKTFLKKHRSRF